MKPLKIDFPKGQPREWQSLGWKCPEAGDCRHEFYAVTEIGSPIVISLKFALPPFYLPGAPAVLRGEPLPEAVCVELVSSRLLPPLCFQSREEHDSRVDHYVAFEPWKLELLKSTGEFLSLSPEDDGPLQERLEEWRTVMRAQYEQERDAWVREIERLRTGSLTHLRLESEEQRARRLAEAHRQLAAVESDRCPTGAHGPAPGAGWVKLTLDDVKRGAAGIRDRWMQEQWAAKAGADLAAMARDSVRVRNWLVQHTGTPALVYDSVANERRREVVAPDFRDNFEQQPGFLMACARVAYRARFADKAGTVVFLADFEVREELDADELEEVARLAQPRSWSLPAPGAPAAHKTDTDLAPPAEPAATGSNGTTEPARPHLEERPGPDARPCVPERPLYRIRKEKTHFELIWEGHSLTAPLNDGFAYLAKFLTAEPTRRWTAVQLYQEVKATVLPDEQKDEGHPPETPAEPGENADQHQAKVNLARLKRRQKELALLIRDLESSRAKGEFITKEEEREGAAALSELQTLGKEIEREERIAAGRSRRDSNDETIKRATIRRRLYEVLAELRKRYAGTAAEHAVATFCEHVNLYLMRSFVSVFRYEPDPKTGVSWT